MCLAMPVQVLKLLPEHRALVHLGGIEKDISVALIEELKEGDFVVLHAGFALTRLNEEEAQKTLRLFQEMAEVTL